MPEKMPDDAGAQEIVVYAGPGVELSLPLDREHETIWASQAQIEQLFGIARSNVSRHIRKAFDEEEVDEESNLRKTQIASSDKPVTSYSLDVILAAGLHRYGEWNPTEGCPYPPLSRSAMGRRLRWRFSGATSIFHPASA